MHIIIIIRYNNICLCNNHHADNDKEQDQWQQNKEPGDSTVSVLADQIQDPSPEQDVKHLNDENEDSARNLAGIATNIVHATVS
jgi:hypothetical protein